MTRVRSVNRIRFSCGSAPHCFPAIRLPDLRAHGIRPATLEMVPVRSGLRDGDFAGRIRAPAEGRATAEAAGAHA